MPEIELKDFSTIKLEKVVADVPDEEANDIDERNKGPHFGETSEYTDEDGNTHTIYIS